MSSVPHVFIIVLAFNQIVRYSVGNQLNQFPHEKNLHRSIFVILDHT